MCRCPQASTLAIDMADAPPFGLRLETKMVVQVTNVLLDGMLWLTHGAMYETTGTRPKQWWMNHSG